MYFLKITLKIYFKFNQQVNV